MNETLPNFLYLFLFYHRLSRSQGVDIFIYFFRCLFKSLTYSVFKSSVRYLWKEAIPAAMGDLPLVENSFPRAMVQAFSGQNCCQLAINIVDQNLSFCGFLVLGPGVIYKGSKDSYELPLILPFTPPFLSVPQPPVQILQQLLAIPSAVAARILIILIDSSECFLIVW